MSRRNQKTVDVVAIVKLFGGKHQIVSDFEKILRIIITPKAVEKWIERESIPSSQILNLKAISGRKNLTFTYDEYIK